MFTYETADQKEVRRFRIAQFNGRMATVKAGESTVTGFVRSVLEQDSTIPRDFQTADRTRGGLRRIGAADRGIV